MGDEMDVRDVRFTIPEQIPVMVMMTRTELSTLTEAARFWDLTVSAFMRQKALDAVKTPQVAIVYAPQATGGMR